jgi:hypothetical protein
MSIRIAVAAALRPRHRLAAAARFPSAVTVIVVALGLVLGGVGIAGAATGGTFILGQPSTESGTAKLSDSHSTPLSLSAARNKAPLAVNRTVMVRNLNAQYLGGLSAASLKLTGGDGFVAPNADVALTHNSFIEVAGTGHLPAGVYYVTATALIDLTTGDYEGECALYQDHDYIGSVGGGDGTNYVQAAETITVQLKNGDSLQENCDVDGTGNGSEAIDAALTAVRVASSSGAKPAS